MYLCQCGVNTERFFSGDLNVEVFYDDVEYSLNGNYCVTIQNLCDGDRIHMSKKPFIFLIKWLAYFEKMDIKANFIKEKPTHEISVECIERYDKYKVSCNNKSITVRIIYSYGLARLEKMISERLIEVIEARMKRKSSDVLTVFL